MSASRDLKRLKSPPRTVGAADFLKAAEDGNLSVINTYIAERSENEADMNVVLWNGRTALMLAAGNGYAEIVSALLAVPTVNINLEDTELETAFNFAAYAGHEQCARLLLAAGCCIKYKDEVLKIIEDNDHLQLLKVIKQSEHRLAWMQSLQPTLNLHHELIARVLALSIKRYEMFSEIIGYFIIAAALDEKNFLACLTRAENRPAKIALTGLNETKDNRHYRYDLASGISFFVARDSAKEGEFAGNNGYVCKAYASKEDAVPAYAVKWVRDAKLAQHEAKHNTQLGHAACWFQSHVPSKRVGIMYPWQSGINLQSMTKREIMNLPWLTRLRILIGILNMLNELHSKLYVHNDIKSANVVVEPLRETAVLIDFGSTRRLNCRVGFNKDMFGLSKIVAKLSQCHSSDRSQLKSVFTRLLVALKQAKTRCPISSEQALTFCVDAENQYRTLNERTLDEIAKRTIGRNELTQEDIIRGRYLP